MKVPGNTVKLGDITLRPENVNVDTIKTLAEKVANSGVEEAKEAKTAIDKWAKTGEISGDDYAKVDDFRKAAGRQFRDLKSEFWDRKNKGASWEDLKPVEAKMGKVGAFLHLNDKIRTELREATALTAVQAAAGASFSGPVGVVALYAAYANGSTWDASADKATKELLETYQGYLSGDSRMITEGNHVEQVHREHLWHSMNGELNEGIGEAKDGKPVELTEQYYELT
ncbi:MAG: hypothetical protein KC910_37610, partial [Candidatus Eremiobacteraeota bacterium]|nr:hypothetical protein [Candidatus Eremiobacteraeota bacterium]